ncbi:MAG: DUF2029 domain-containing protein [Chloroflexi bacterium]|nr:DUF2029 domain-containing protein [Chloroflexota bacterium]
MTRASMQNKLKLLIFVAAFLLVYSPFLRTHGTDLFHEDSRDFPSFYFGARLAFEEDLSPYAKTNLRSIFKDYSDNHGDYYPYLYLPTSLIFFLPFTWFDYVLARQIMLVLNHLFLLVFVFFFLFKVLKIGPDHLYSTLFVLYVFSFAPLFVVMDSGQVNLAVLLLTCLSWSASKENRHPFWIALPLALAVILKLYPILFLVPLFFKKQYQAIGMVVLLLLILSAGVSLFLPPGTWATWYENVGSKGYADVVLGFSTNAPANQSMNGLLMRTFFGKNIRFDPILTVPDWVSRSAPYASSGVVLVISLLASALARRNPAVDSNRLVDLEFSLWSAVSFLIAPVSWDHHLVFLIPAVAVLVYHLLYGRNRRNLLLSGAAVALAVFLARPYPYNAPEFREGMKTLLISGSLYGVGLMWIFYSFMLGRFATARGRGGPTIT